MTERMNHPREVAPQHRAELLDGPAQPEFNKRVISAGQVR